MVEHLDTRENFIQLLKEENPGVIIIKFGATWCKPCFRIKNYINNKFNSMNQNVLCIDLDIDHCKQIYSFLKSRKMIRGIPSVICYFKKKEEDISDFDIYIPDKSVTGADIGALDKLFEEVKNRS